jgi:hypothetical protein
MNMSRQINPITLRRNAVVEFDRADGSTTTERVLYINEKARTVVLIDIKSPTANYYEMRQSDYVAAFKGQSARLVRDPYAYLHRPIHRFSAAMHRERDARLKVMEPYLSAKCADRFNNVRRKGIIRRIWDKTLPGTHVSKPEAYDLVRKYLQRGQTENALLSDRDNAGYTKKRREVNPPRKREGRSYKAKGRERSGIPIPFNRQIAISVEVIKLRDTPNKKTGRKMTWRDVHTEICRTFFPSHTEIVLGKLAIVPLPTSQCPTQKQLRRLYYSQANPEDALRGREGDHLFNLGYRALMGDQRELAYGPMKVVQIDFTIADIYLVDSTRTRIIGRPTIALITDTFSRLIIGFAVAWRRESWAVATLAILNMAGDKAEFCSQYGVDLGTAMWPSAMFETALSDNGAMISYLKQHFQDNLGLHFEHTGSGRGDLKPVVESGFRRMNEELIYRLEGCLPRTRDSRQMKKIIKNARSNAMYTLQDFTALVAEYCIYRNNHCLVEGYPISDDMAGRVAPLPIRLWEYGIAHRSGLPREEPIDLVRMACLSRGEATVREDGLYFARKTYTCECGEREGWFVRARSHRWKVEILYHLSNLSVIYLDNPAQKRTDVDNLLEPCFRTKTEGDFPTTSLYENELLQQARADTNHETREESTQHQSRYLSGIDARRERARSAKRNKRNEAPVGATQNMSVLRQKAVDEGDLHIHDDLLGRVPETTFSQPPVPILEELEAMDRKSRREQRIRQGDR